MSVSASIDIKVVKKNNCKITIREVIKKLLDYGWTLNDNGQISYLPLGDNDDFDWQYENITIDALMDIICKKEEQKEIVGIVLTWQDTSIGGSFLFVGNGSILVNLNINRKMISNKIETRITDVSWYISKIIPVLNQGCMQVEMFFYEEHV